MECICNAANLPFPDEAARDSFITCWQEAIQRRIDAWHAFLKDHPHQPGTISSVADEYFSALAWMGQKVYVERLAQGHAQGTAVKGRFAGIDIWGRASVITSDGSELMCAPEQVLMRLAD